MRTLWVLILFGSLIIHHCFTTTSGEAVPSNKETQPSYSDCKPYVDAALKGDIPPEATPSDPADISSEENKDHGSEDQDHDHDYDKKLQSDESNEEENTGSSEESHTGSTGAVNVESSEEEDKEEPEINGLEIEEDEQADENKGSDATAEDSSEEEPPPVTPPQAKLPPPKPVKEPTRSPKATKAEEPAKKDGAQSNESDENDTREAVTSNPAPTTPQPNRASHNSVAKDTHEPTPSRSSPPPTPPADKTDNKNKKVSNPTKETQSEVKKPVPPRVAEDSDEDSVEEEIVVKKNVKTTKEDSKSKPVESDEADNDSDEEIKTKAKKPVKKIVKIDDASDESESEEDVQEVKPKKANKPKAKESKVKAAPKKPVDDSDEDDNDDRSAEKDYEPRSRDKIIRILGLDDTTDLKQKNGLLDKVTQQTLKELKSTYEYAIKPLETLYKYRDLSNRHFGDPEIFSKPMIVFMGPWSGGKSTIINWLLGIQDDEHALRTGADPSPAQFNILTHGSEEEVLDGTQLAADWTFSGLQKFGQSFLDRLRGRKLPNRLLEKVNLVEIPGILEIRKQVERSFPFNDACQWFIDRADVLFLVYDPAKLDIGPETEAILDQLKGRESQVRIVLNKADTVKPDELLRVQATLIWNISPLMASAEPPVLYVASLWDHPLQPDAPASLLNAHETLFLKDISDATHKRVETRIAAARRFAVRVRNHAKMCDCYLNTYNNHRSFFSNKKRISDDIIEHPQNYHIYEGLSTLTNISRYDLPDPDSYRDFFRLNPVWEFPTLASTCTYFRGCPINKLDIAIAYDLPELLGRYRRQRESIVTAPTGTLPDIKLKDVAEKKDAPIDIPKGKSRWYKLPLEEQQAQQVETPPPKGKPKEAPATPQPPSKKEPPQKPKNKWWKEVPEVVAKVEVKGNKDEGAKKSKKEEVVVKKLKPKEGFNIIQPKNKWWNEYYEPIKSKDPQPQLPKKNKWYKT